MANDLTLPSTISNGVGNWPDADQLMDNYNELNDRIWKAVAPPADPAKTPIWIKTDEPEQLQLRIYLGGNWWNIMLGGIVG